MKKYEIEIVKRGSYRVDKGTMGFHDYVVEYESITEFLDRVKKKLSDISGIHSEPQIQFMEQNGEIEKVVITYISENTL